MASQRSGFGDAPTCVCNRNDDRQAPGRQRGRRARAAGLTMDSMTTTVVVEIAPADDSSSAARSMLEACNVAMHRAGVCLVAMRFSTTNAPRSRS